MAESFLWHDYETFGISPRRDRPSQFAAIRTDSDLNEIGQPINIFCKIPDDYLPDPIACLLTGITPQKCQQDGLLEADFAKQIEHALAYPGTIGVGYNSIRFDDEVTRFLFWRNLIDPYSREWRNQCSRWDILDMVRTVYALKPDTLNWPLKPDGKPSFKLENLSVANGLLHEAAHDALSDVRATIGLAKLIKQRQPKLFDYCLSLRKKEKVLLEMGWPEQKPFLHISGRFPIERGSMAWMWPLAEHPKNKNELIAWDLAFDPSILSQLSADEVRAQMYMTNEQLAEKGLQRLAIKSIHINKSPIVIANPKVMSPALAKQYGFDNLALYDGHLQNAKNLYLQQDFWSQLFLPFDSTDNDVEEDLYNGFLNSEDRRKLDFYRGLSAAELALKSRAFNDERLEELLFRYRCKNQYTFLSVEEKQVWHEHCLTRLTTSNHCFRNFDSFFQEINRLELSTQENTDNEKKLNHLQILRDLKLFGQQQREILQIVTS